MYLVDSLPAPYYEEREAAEAAKRLDRLREQKAQAQQRAQPPQTRPQATGVLGNIFQGLVRAGVAQSPSPPPGKAASSGASTPVATPPAKVMTQAELEALMAEKKDADIVGFRAW